MPIYSHNEPATRHLTLESAITLGTHTEPPISEYGIMMNSAGWRRAACLESLACRPRSRAASSRQCPASAERKQMVLGRGPQPGASAQVVTLPFNIARMTTHHASTAHTHPASDCPTLYGKIPNSMSKGRVPAPPLLDCAHPPIFCSASVLWVQALRSQVVRTKPAHCTPTRPWGSGGLLPQLNSIASYGERGLFDEGISLAKLDLMRPSM